MHAARSIEDRFCSWEQLALVAAGHVEIALDARPERDLGEFPRP